MNDHPVWYVYDELRTAKLNVYYYRSRLGQVRRWNTVREMAMAATGSSAVAGLWFFTSGAGIILWKALATLSAFIAVYQSVTRPSERIRKLESQVTGWAQLEHSLADIRRRIHEMGAYTELLQREVKAVLDGKLGIVTDLVETDIDTDLRDRCFDQVKRELPPSVFFVPVAQVENVANSNVKEHG